MSKRAISLEKKIYLAVAAVSLVVLVVTLSLSARDSRELMTHIMEDQTEQMALSYFDSLNVLMLSGTMSSRQTLQDKILSKPGVQEARVIRSEEINKLFGPGLSGEKPQDDLDRRAMAGEDILHKYTDDEGRHLTVIKPMRALSDYNGTNCLTCHQVAEGTVLGAVRVTISLAEFDQQIDSSIWAQGISLLVLFGIGLLGLMFVIRRLVIRRVKRLRNAIERIERESDLTTRLTIQYHDEIGDTNTAFNGMLDRFQSSLHEVVDTTQQLGRAAREISANAASTAKAVQEQQTGTDMMASAINEMEATSQDFRSNAEQTAHASGEANEAAQQGASKNQQVIKAINGLSEEITQASAVISTLDERTQSVGSVLGVIKGIAEQTNLLALNAAIEAARAGESGRGFAVVADEVRALATRTQESAEEIESMIADLKKEAEGAVQVMGRANQAATDSVELVGGASDLLQTITEKVAGIKDLNAQMLSVADDQTQAAAEINDTVLRIAQIAEQSAGDASRTAELTEQLQGLADQLNGLVDRFKI